MDEETGTREDELVCSVAPGQVPKSRNCSLVANCPNTMNPSYSLDFVAIGANRQANCSSWGENGLVTYSASKFVGIYDPLVRIKMFFILLQLRYATFSLIGAHKLTFIFKFLDFRF